MEQLQLRHNKLVRDTSLFYIRNYINTIDWNNRLIGIKGARGVGKTTLILQYIKTQLQSNKVLYVSLDDLYFSSNDLIELAESFINLGGTHLFIDEVHYYDNWSNEIKYIYDTYPELKIIFTGSSILQLSKANVDLSRRAVIYDMFGLSFREFLAIEKIIDIKKVTVSDILNSHQDIVNELVTKFKPIAAFKDYLQFGYYPYFRESKDSYLQKLNEVIVLTLEIDMPKLTAISRENISKLKKLLYIIAHSVPFEPNVSKISEIIQVTRNTLVTYLNDLEKAHLLQLLHTDNTGIGYLQKPAKIYLGNSNLMYAIAKENISIGTIRETFFLNQVRVLHDLTYSKNGDFIVDKKFTFEVGGRNKKNIQIKGIENSFIAADDMEIGIGNKIPLWIFGLLY